MSTGLWLTCCILHILLLQRVYTIDMVPAFLIPVRPLTDILLESSNYSLECNASGQPKPTYRWTFNENNVTDAMSINSKTGTLTIEEFSVTEEGRYQCFAQNTIRGRNLSALSPVVTLKKAWMDFSWISEPVDVIVYDGDYVKMTCDDPPLSVPSGKFVWYRVSRTGNENIEENERIHIDAEGSLHILKVKKDDQQSYKCAVFNPSLQLIKLGSEHHLSVNDTKSGDKDVVLRFKTSSSTKFLKSKNVQLECVFSGKPNPAITWAGPNGNLIEESDKYSLDNVIMGRRLVVNDLAEEDEGNYTCKSATGQEEHVWLDVTSPPIWENQLVTQIVPENRNASFTCKARPAIGDAPLNPTKWLLNGNPLNIRDHARFKMNEDWSMLTITNLNKTTDLMCFQCNVSNDIGFEFGNGCLQVIKPIVIDSFAEVQQNISKGEIINLTVTGSGDPDFPPLYRWFFNDAPFDLQTKHYISYNETTKEAYINTSVLTDKEYKQTAGLYQIELYNKYDSAIVSTQVALKTDQGVEEHVSVVPVAAAGVQTRGPWWISIVIAVVLCVIIVIIVIVICKRRLRKKRLYKARQIAGDKANIMESVDPGEEYESRLSIEPESLDTEADANERKAWSEYPESDDDIDARDFDEDGSFIGNYERSRYSLNRL